MVGNFFNFKIYIPMLDKDVTLEWCKNFYSSADNEFFRKNQEDGSPVKKRESVLKKQVSDVTPKSHYHDEVKEMRKTGFHTNKKLYDPVERVRVRVLSNRKLPVNF